MFYSVIRIRRRFVWWPRAHICTLPTFDKPFYFQIFNVRRRAFVVADKSVRVFWMAAW